MSVELTDFFEHPSEEGFSQLSKKQLLEVADKFEIPLTTKDKSLKEGLGLVIKAALVKLGILTCELGSPLPLIGDQEQTKKKFPEGTVTSLTFEQQKQLLLLEMEKNKMSQEVELRRLDVEAQRFALIREGRLGNYDSTPKAFDVARALKLMPKFDDNDLDTFFNLFERLAGLMRWEDSEQTLLLQCVFYGKAQRAYSTLTVRDSQIYSKVKETVLKAYELVPEAYRQRFRALRKGAQQTFTEFARELRIQFDRWRSVSQVEDFDSLCELLLLEQFRNTLPENLSVYLTERNVQSAEAAAVLADEYVLTHKDVKRTNWRRPNSSVDNVSVEVPSLPANVKAEKKLRAFGDKSDQCAYCLNKGHWKKDCPALKAKMNRTKSDLKPALAASSVTTVVEGVDVNTAQGNLVLCSDEKLSYAPFITDGSVSLVGSDEKIPVKILRDTGASETFILESVLPFSESSSTGSEVLIKGIGLQVLSVPLHTMVLESELITGQVVVGVRPSLPVEGIAVILGNNLAGGRVWRDVPPPPIVTDSPSSLLEQVDVDKQFPDVFVTCAVTRAMSKNVVENQDKEPRQIRDRRKVFPNLSLLFPTVSRQELVVAQREDPSLKEMFSEVLAPEEVASAMSGCFVEDGLLLRKWLSGREVPIGEPYEQVVVPMSLRDTVLRWAHGDVVGHLGVNKTYNHLLRYFYWPQLKKDVRRFIKTCSTCQLTGKPNQCLKPAPLYPIPVIDTPFQHLIIDCVGPLPPSKSGSAYLLTVMCQNTRYPAAYPLRSITTRAIVKAMTQFISVFGIPRVIQSDQGSNFTSHMFKEVLQQLGVKQNQSSAYHPQSQGALERFHQTLKSLLRAYCVELKGDWEEGLPWLMLAAREVVQDSLGFSPNQLVFGHKVRGPLALLHDGLKEVSDPPQGLLQYVEGFRRRLFLAGQMAKENLLNKQKKMKRLFDRNTESRVFCPGDQVLALLPLPTSPFCAKFLGPYTVVRQVSEQNYLISTPERKRHSQLCHVNLLKPFYSRFSESEKAPVAVAIASSVTEMAEDVKVPEDGILQPRLNNSETLKKLDEFVKHLPFKQRDELSSLISDFPMLFSDSPSRTNVIEHDIDVGDAKPIRQHFYRVSLEKQRHLESEIKYMIENNIAKPSFSSWASPCLLVGKPDGTYRFCTDYRKLNNITKPDSFPLPRMEDCVDAVGSALYVSKFDLLKGYWQVPLTTRAQEIASFITPSGLYSYSVMSFGLRNAPATFQRLMNRVTSGLDGCAVYLDDVVVYSDSWEQHIVRIRALFERLAEAKLTVNLAKCELAKATVTYLGKVVGQGNVRPVRAKVLAIDNFPPPNTKRELMRFLGMVGYYRSFCSNFSSVVAPLTDLLKKSVKFEWSLQCKQAFDNVKLLLSTAPVLAAPRIGYPFQIQVDASQVGAGAVLLQTDEHGIERPVCYFSRKFRAHQLHYSTIEKEALALIWALQFFEVYLTSGTFPIVVFSDHNPLTFLHSLQSPNQRLIRWSLFLQPYPLEIRHIRGVENVLADALSRAPCENLDT